MTIRVLILIINFILQIYFSLKFYANEILSCLEVFWPILLNACFGSKELSSKFYRSLCGWYGDTCDSSPDSTSALRVALSVNVGF